MHYLSNNPKIIFLVHIQKGRKPVITKRWNNSAEVAFFFFFLPRQENILSCQNIPTNLEKYDVKDLGFFFFSKYNSIHTSTIHATYIWGEGDVAAKSRISQYQKISLDFCIPIEDWSVATNVNSYYSTLLISSETYLPTVKKKVSK